MTSTPDDARLASLSSNIQSKLAQLKHYRDHDCQLDHAKTIAEGRIIQLEQVAHWIATEHAAPALRQPRELIDREPDHGQYAATLDDARGELLARAEHYINCNAAESGADILIAELADALRAAPVPQCAEAADILQALFPLHRMVLEQHANAHDDVNIGWTIDLGTLRRASKFIATALPSADRGCGTPGCTDPNCTYGRECPYCDADMDGNNCSACGRSRVPPEGYARSSTHQAGGK